MSMQELTEIRAEEGGMSGGYVARQPILDAGGRIYGYDLNFRYGLESCFAGHLSEGSAPDHHILFGLGRLTGGAPVFVRCPSEAVSERLVELLMPSTTVLEIAEPMQPQVGVLASCRALKRLGFRLAMGSYCWESGYEPLVEFADFLKVDFGSISPSARYYLRSKTMRSTLAVIAQNVETREDYNFAAGEGLRLFQGYYFCQAQVATQRKVPANRLAHLRILELLHQTPFDLHALSEQVKGDPALTYRLLRLVNSPISAIRKEITSIEMALMVVGEDVFCRMAMLAIAGELSSGRSGIILRMALLRARFCELAAGLCGQDPNEQYLVGMMSLLPIMLQVSMDELIKLLPFREAVRAALIGEDRPERILLDWIIRHERNEWERCDALAARCCLSPDRLARLYGDAVLWSEATAGFAA